MLWKTFLSCTTAVATMAMAEALAHGEFSHWTAASLKFGNLRVVDVTPTTVIPGAIILGVISGLLGPLFINVNFRVNGYRGIYYKHKYQKLLDAWMFCFVTATVWYWVPYWT